MFRTRPQGGAVIFVHIPKTAGTSMVGVVGKHNEPRIYWIRGAAGAREAFEALPERERGSYTMLSGHQGFGMHELVACPWIYLTIVRDPVDRMVSHYYHILQEPEHYLYRVVAGRGLSLLDYATAGLSIESDNGQTRMLADRALARTTPLGAGDERLLDSARRNLDAHFGVVGLTDRFDETLALTSRYLGWSIPPAAMRARESHARPRGDAIPADVRRAVRERNALDVLLVDHVRARFDAHVRSLGPAFESEVNAIRAARDQAGRRREPA